MRGDRRQQTLRSWRQRHGSTALEPPKQPANGTRIRRRHRAPTPRLAPTGGWRGPIARRLAIAVLAPTALALVAVGLWRSPSLYVAHGSVTGNDRHWAEEIYDAAGVDGRHYFSIDWHRAEDGIRALGGIRQATVRPDWPAGVRIEVAESALVLAWIDDQGARAVDEMGAVEPLRDLAALPRVSGSRIPLDQDGRLNAEVLAAATAYLRRFPELVYNESTGFAVQTAEGWSVRLGHDPGLASAQLATFEVLLAQLPPMGSRGTLDLRFPLRPYYRNSEGAP